MNNAKGLTAQHRLEQWTMIAQQCVSSGLSAKDWCKANNISRDKYYYWLRKLKLASGEIIRTKAPTTDTPCIVPILPKTIAPIIQVEECFSDQTAIIVRLNGLVIEIKNNATEAIIGRVLRVLRQQ